MSSKKNPEMLSSVRATSVDIQASISMHTGCCVRGLKRCLSLSVATSGYKVIKDLFCAWTDDVVSQFDSTFSV